MAWSVLSVSIKPVANVHFSTRVRKGCYGRIVTLWQVRCTFAVAFKCQRVVLRSIRKWSVVTVNGLLEGSCVNREDIFRPSRDYSHSWKRLENWHIWWGRYRRWKCAKWVDCRSCLQWWSFVLLHSYSSAWANLILFSLRYPRASSPCWCKCICNACICKNVALCCSCIR